MLWLRTCNVKENKFLCFLFFLVDIVVFSHLCRRGGESHYSTLNNDCCTVVDDRTVSPRDDDLGLHSIDV